MISMAQVGAQSYSFREFDFKGSLFQLTDLTLKSMEYCGVHFPADPDNPELPAIIEAVAAEGITTPCYGVEGFTADDAANRKKFEFAKKLGCSIITAYTEPDSFESLEALTEEFDINIAIHNHGPGHRFDKVADTLAAIEGRSPRIGACVDTGHALRSGEAPQEVIEQLGDRVLSLHLKDWDMAENEEACIGEGDMDCEKVVASLNALNFTGPIMMEYEEEPHSPVASMLQGKAFFELLL
jgi:sugar phosphate isomerase/epimerase